MRIGNTFPRFFHRTTNKAKKRSERELFHADGWIPQAQPPRRYAGPAFPAPMLPRRAKVPAEPARLCNAAREEWSRGDLRQAEQTYLLAEAQMPETPELLFEHAQLLLTKDRYDEAEALLIRATEMNPNRYEFWLSLLWISFTRADRETSMSRFTKIICCVDTPEKIRTEAADLCRVLD